jgi:mono/diheme cytochrome c family protein
MKKYSTWIWVGGIVAFMVVAFAFFGSGSAGTGPDAGTGIAVQDPALVATGEPLYQTNCAECHGSDLRGTDTGPSHLSVVYQPSHHADLAFMLAARNGVQQHHWPFGDMLPVPTLSDADLEAIVAYVRENQRISGFEPYPP